MPVPRPPRASSANDDPSTPNSPGTAFDQQSQVHEAGAAPGTGRKKRNHRGGKKKRARRPSFAAPSEEDGSGLPETAQGRNHKHGAARASFYRLQGGNHSNTSMDSEELLDHRDQQSMRPRRASTLPQTIFGQSLRESPNSARPQYSNPFSSQERPRSRSRRGNSGHNSTVNLDEDADERTPMLSTSMPRGSGYGGYNGGSIPRLNGKSRKSSSSSEASKKKPSIFDRDATVRAQKTPTYNVNYPPSIPGSPEMSASHRPMSFGDILARDEFSPERSLEESDRGGYEPDIGESAFEERERERSRSLHDISQRSEFDRLERRPTIAARAEEDVCFPIERLSELGEEEELPQRDENGFRRGLRRRRGQWPDLAVLDEWSRVEKEGRSEERRVKRMVEPQLIGGRLRPTHARNWHRAEEDAPYRFTYFNEDFPSTIHSQTISELVQPGGSFRELFVPDPPQLSDSSSDEDETVSMPADERLFRHSPGVGTNGEARAPTRQSSAMENLRPWSSAPNGKSTSRVSTPVGYKKSPSRNMHENQDSSKAPSAEPSSANRSPETKPDKPKRYGERPTWWLDVLSPTDAEMKVLSKAFGIHPLTAEDIMMQEAREKVELFRNYYFVNYRSFEQDMSNEDFLEPVNMYVVVFREGVISFHFSLTPHPANVRRRIRQLKDYLVLSSDWISYAIIDDITDVFAPLIQNIEDEVDDIDDVILRLHSTSRDDKSPSKSATDEKRSDAGGTVESDGDMLRRVGDCRKKVMGLYRLLGNKADVIKGFAKRCNEHWEVAPRSEIGLYLGDIQDHIVTMTGNLSHYEKILARSHGNYLAQINIRMNERQEQTADVLGRLTVLGTIVLPMNIITGLWGMNVWVPGQESEGSLTWFMWITVGLFAFGLACFFLARTFYRIV